MKPDCERCGRDLPPGSNEAFICSFECTFCAECVAGPLGGTCPNCSGDFQPRPTRAEHLLERYPPSMERKGPQ